MLKRERRGGGGGRGALINIFARKRVVGVTVNRSLFETGVLIGTISRNFTRKHLQQSFVVSSLPSPQSSSPSQTHIL